MNNRINTEIVEVNRAMWAICQHLDEALSEFESLAFQKSKTEREYRKAKAVSIVTQRKNNVYIFENIEAVRRGITPTLLANNDNEIAWSYHNHNIKGFTTIAVYNEIGLDLSERAYISEEISREVNGKWFNV